MGYDFHITRKEDWSDDFSDARDITLEEWLSYIDNDPELELTEGYWIKIPGSETESQPAPGFCEWNAHPLDERPWFDYSNGNISTKNPDDATIRKMLAITEVLNAKLQGDDGEIYVISRTNEVVRGPLRYGDKDDPYAEENKPWWKFW
jgi:hypothetical protein